jgi:hypothetical protein
MVEPRAFQPTVPAGTGELAVDPQPRERTDDSPTTPFTVILENDPEYTGRGRVLPDYFQWAETIQAVDIDDAWLEARHKYYDQNYRDTAHNCRVQIVDIKEGVLEFAPRARPSPPMPKIIEGTVEEAGTTVEGEAGTTVEEQVEPVEKANWIGKEGDRPTGEEERVLESPSKKSS